MYKQNYNLSILLYSLFNKKSDKKIVRTVDEVQLLLETVISFKSKVYEGIDWESVKEKYELTENNFLEAFPSKISQDFMESRFLRGKRLQQK